MATQPELNIVSESLEVGTRIHWDDKDHCLYFVDIPSSVIYRYDPISKKTAKAKVANEPLSFAFPIENSPHKFIAAVANKFDIITWDGKSDRVSSVETIVAVDTEEEFKGNRLNGGKIDPYGRLWAGTMGPTGPDGKTIPNRGSLYCLTGRTVKKHLSNIGISNGLAWNTKKRKMYYVDTLFPGLYQFDYDPNSGDISNQKVVFEFEKFDIPGLPDGLVIDADDKLWITSIFGSRIIRVDPKNGDLLQTIMFPTTQVTSVIFGGINLDVLYVTTAKIVVDGVQPDYPAGCTYSVTGLSVKGLPGSNFKLRI